MERLDRDVLADGARDDDERQVVPEAPHDPQGLRCAEGGQRIVGHHDVPRPARERLRQRRGGLDALGRHREAAAVQLAQHELGVGLDVLDQQDAEWPHPGHGPTGAISLSTSQYSPIWRAASMNWTKSTGLRT